MTPPPATPRNPALGCCRYDSPHHVPSGEDGITTSICDSEGYVSQPLPCYLAKLCVDTPAGTDFDIPFNVSLFAL